MSPQNERRVPRPHPTIDEQLKKALEDISRTARHMEALEDKALQYENKTAPDYATETGYPGAMQATLNRGIGRAPEPVQETLNRGYGSPGLKALTGNPPEFTPPHARVLQAERRVLEARARLESLCESLVGPVPLQDMPEMDEPNPWGGAAGETAGAALRIRYECERIHALLRALETLA